ncbi:hypothetical protein [Actinomadura bangladeshensis]|uniref:Uncharacterized protein n=1 Tax=Actinomadura bangladeshensis TaxID=453573 RepID=A0A4R4NY22_9ACTN|nr:hypothetical protein [Actinomadura bangladeshensis]TDC12392.1 hypothetical protein E1284_23620 [Actinomadura bangladeshensis]
MADDSGANPWIPAAWGEIGWPWDLTSSYLRAGYLEELPRTDAHIAEALDALQRTLAAKTSEPGLQWSRPLEELLPTGMWTAWSQLLARLRDTMPRLSTISATRVRDVALEFAPRAAIPPEIARRAAPGLLTAWLGNLAERMAVQSLTWAEDALRERRDSPQLTAYLDLAAGFAPKVSEKFGYHLMSGLRITGRESALPYLERLAAPELPAAVREEAEQQAQILLNDLVKDSEGGWL